MFLLIVDDEEVQSQQSPDLTIKGDPKQFSDSSLAQLSLHADVPSFSSIS